MKTYNSNYLGLCVNNNDPEFRGRVQVFIPHIMPALYEDWNSAGKDIEISCVDDNMTDGIDSKTLDKLKKILPYAEAASPIVCASAPGQLVQTSSGGAVYNQTPVPNGTAYAAATNAMGADQGAVAPTQSGLATNQNEQELMRNAGMNAGGDARGSAVAANFNNESTKAGGNCARGTAAVIGTMTGNSAFLRGANGVGGNAWDFAIGGRPAYNPFTASGMYNQAASFNKNDPNYKPQIGDAVVMGRHIQTFNGTRWVSDFNQRGIGGKGEQGTIYRMNDAGLSAIQKQSPGLYNDWATKNGKPPIDGTTGQPDAGALTYTSSSGRPPAAPAGAQDRADPTVNSPDTATYTEGMSGAALSGTDSQMLAGALPGSKNQNAMYVNPHSQYDDAYKAILEANPSFLQNPPAGSASLGILQQGANGVTREQAAASWATMMTKMAAVESGFKVSTSNLSDPGGSHGLLQFSDAHANQYYGKKAGIKITPQMLNSDPAISNRVMVGYLDSLAKRGGTLDAGPGKSGGRFVGGGGIIGSHTMDFLRREAKNPLDTTLSKDSDWVRATRINTTGAPGVVTNHADTLKMAGAPGSTSMVQTIDRGGATPVTNTNNMAKGMFTVPAVGAMLWVFFREGNPLFPVYFAASYSAAEWGSVYNNKSPAPGNPGGEGDPKNTNSHVTRYNTAAGGFASTTTIDQTDPTKTSNAFEILGPNAQVTFTDSGDYFFSRLNRRDHIEGNSFVTILGNQERWVQGETSNEVYLGNRIIKVGNVTQEAINAATELQQLMEKSQAPLAKPSK